MSLNFTPKTEDEIARDNLLPDGLYPYEVKSAADKTSNAGNPMIHLELHVFDTDNKIRLLDDYLLAKMAYKLRHFCAHAGLLDNYQQGSLSAADCEGKGGWVKITSQQDKEKKFPPRNQVSDYVASPGTSTALPPLTNDQIGNIEAAKPGDEDVPY